MAPSIEFVTRAGCHLCQDALLTVQQVAAQRRVPVQVTELGDHPQAAELAEFVPVIFVNGAQVATWRVTADQLHAALDGRPRWFERFMGPRSSGPSSSGR